MCVIDFDFCSGSMEKWNDLKFVCVCAYFPFSLKCVYVFDGHFCVSVYVFWFIVRYDLCYVVCVYDMF